MGMILTLIRKIDPADVLLFIGLLSLTLAAGMAHVALGLIVFGLGAFYLGLAAGHAPRGGTD